MVTNPTDKFEIKDLLDKHCVRSPIQSWDVDAQNRINVQGSVILTHVHPRKPHLPLSFGTISGNFVAKGMYLHTLEGAPHHVGGTFNVADSKLTNLKGAPSHVGDILNVGRNPLTSLEGFPAHVEDAFIFDYDPELPLLRAMTAAKLWPNPDQEKLEQIFLKYAHKGKAVVLNLALELKQAGFAGNAKW